MRIALSTDHAGYDFLHKLQRFLISKGHECVDYGPKELNVGDDYPDYIFPAAHAVASGKCEVGIIFGGSGQGEAMTANRVKGVRCAVYYGPEPAEAPVDAKGRKAKDDLEILRLSRQHNDANMLSLGGRFLTEDEVYQAVTIWLGTTFKGEARHVRRIEKLDA